MAISPQEELTINADTAGYEAIPEPELLLRAIPSLHYDKRPRGVECPSLYDALDVDAAHAKLEAAQLEGPEVFDQARVEVARNATKLVSGALWFDPGSKQGGKWVPLSVSELVADQRTDCYGHTVVLSACLDQLHIEHYIAYTNGHTFVVMPTGSGRAASAWIFDAVPKEPHVNLSKPSNPALAQDLDGVIVDDSIAGVAGQLAEQGRGVFKMDAEALVRKFTRQEETFREASQRNPWLNASGRGSSTELSGSSSLTVSVFEPSQGREILAHHLAFQRAVGKSDYRAAAQLALDLAGEFPDLEVRNPELLNAIRATTNWLCQQRDLTLAAKVTEAFFSSARPFTDGLALQEAKMWLEITWRLAAKLGPLAVGSQTLQGHEAEAVALLSTVRNAGQRAITNAVAYDSSSANEASQLARKLNGDE